MPTVPITRILVGLSGLGIGALSFVMAAYDALYLFSRPVFLIQLYWAISHWRHHLPMADGDIAAIAQVVGALIMLFGTAVLALLLCYFGIPLKAHSNVVLAPPCAPPDASSVPADAGQSVRKGDS